MFRCPTKRSRFLIRRVTMPRSRTPTTPISSFVPTFTQGVKTRFGWPGKEREYVVDTSTKIVTPIPKIGKRSSRHWLKNGKLLILDDEEADQSSKLSVRLFDPISMSYDSKILSHFSAKLLSKDGSTLVVGRCSNTEALICDVFTFDATIKHRELKLPRSRGHDWYEGHKDRCIGVVHLR